MVLETAQELKNTEGAITTHIDQCMYGLATRGQNNSEVLAVMKPTRFLTKGMWLSQELNRRCDRKHRHQHLIDNRATKAEEYPPLLAEAICRGLITEKKY